MVSEVFADARARSKLRVSQFGPTPLMACAVVLVFSTEPLAAYWEQPAATAGASTVMAEPTRDHEKT